MGMTYDQFWNDDAELVKYYRKAYDLKQKQKNYELWLQGLYIYEALCDVSPVLHAFAKAGTKPLPYPEKPYPISREEIREEIERKRKANRERAKASFIKWASRLNLPEEVGSSGNHD